MKHLFLLLVLMTLCIPGFARAQANFTTSELDTLVSNIALYPDPLLVHVLTASTFGNEIPAANAWAQGHKHLKGESLAAAMEKDNLTYDPSVQALLPFPTVLEMMSKYKAWCDQLGDAVTNQKDDVMEAIQRMRQSAYDHGHLRTNEQVEVAESSGNIVIAPVKTEVVYVPVYNPRVLGPARHLRAQHPLVPPPSDSTPSAWLQAASAPAPSSVCRSASRPTCSAACRPAPCTAGRSVTPSGSCAPYDGRPGFARCSGTGSVPCFYGTR